MTWDVLVVGAGPAGSTAAALLAEAGYPDGFEMDLWQYASHQKLFNQAAMQMLSKVGIKVKLHDYIGNSGQMTQLRRAGKLTGIALRVPVTTGSVVDLTTQMARDVTAEEANAAIKGAAEGPLRGILKYTEDPIVSTDIIGDSHSSIFAGPFTQVIAGNMLKVVSWYDNEWGYSCRTVDLISKLASL